MLVLGRYMDLGRYKLSEKHTVFIFRAQALQTIAYVSLKCWHVPTSIQSITTQKTTLDIFTAVRIVSKYKIIKLTTFWRNFVTIEVIVIET
jgi:hypothetical protein